MAAFCHEFQCIPFYIIEARRDFVAIDVPSLRQAHAASISSKQFDAKEIFKGADLPTDRALRDGEFVRGLSEALMPRCCLECG